MWRIRVLWARVLGQVSQGHEDAALDDEIHEHLALLTSKGKLAALFLMEMVGAF